jgi:hypothetical protein
MNLIPPRVLPPGHGGLIPRESYPPVNLIPRESYPPVTVKPQGDETRGG